MQVKGSCHCGATAFELQTGWCYPLMGCYCGTCRKTNGSPVSLYIKGRRSDLSVVAGVERLRAYRVRTNERFFCGDCGSSLYMLDSRWPEFCWPNAAAVDTPLPTPPRQVHIFVADKVAWFPIHDPGPQFDAYPEWAIEDWHREWGL